PIRSIFHLTPKQPNDIVVLMIPDFDNQGNLPAGIHIITWLEFVERLSFASTSRRSIHDPKRARIPNHPITGGKVCSGAGGLRGEGRRSFGGIAEIRTG